MAESKIEQMRLIGSLTEPAVRNALSAMAFPPGSRGLDAGCGIGSHTLLLAETVGPSGKVMGVDRSQENLSCAEKALADKGWQDRVAFYCRDLGNLPIPDDSLDWVWCADVMWPLPGMEPMAVLGEFRRVVKPGGRIAILFWTTQMLLPGYPELEARLNLAHARTNPYLQDIPPTMHFMRASGWLRAANLNGIGMKGFVAEVSPPLSREKRRAIRLCMSMFWEDLAAQVSASDWSLWQMLADPESPDCIYDHPDYCALIVYSMFHATVPKRKRNERSGCRWHSMNHSGGKNESDRTKKTI